MINTVSVKVSKETCKRKTVCGRDSAQLRNLFYLQHHNYVSTL